MICFFVTAAHRYTVDVYLQTWARKIARRCRVITYESLPLHTWLRGSTFIFTDLERLTPAQCGRAQAWYDCFARAGGRVMNNPSRVMRRADLLRALHDAGRNPFNVYPDGEPLESVRFPVFVREADEHTGALTPLLHTHQQVEEALTRLRQTMPGRRLLIVEYLETAGVDGRYWKRSIMRVGEQFVPRHMMVSANWVTKTPGGAVEETALAEERLFLGGNEGNEGGGGAEDVSRPDGVRSAFDLAGIDYGRIDYALWNDRIVTWEINTNPILVPIPERCNPLRLPGQCHSANLINGALMALDGVDVEVRPCSLPPVMCERLPFSWRAIQMSAGVWRGVSRVKAGKRFVRALRTSLELS